MVSHDNNLSSDQDSLGFGNLLHSDDSEQSSDVEGDLNGSSDKDQSNSS